MSLRTRIGWVLRGHDNTVASLSALSADVRQLQQRVDALFDVVHGLTAEAQHRDQANLEALRDAIIVATDDLSARIAAVNARVDGT